MSFLARFRTGSRASGNIDWRAAILALLLGGSCAHDAPFAYHVGPLPTAWQPLRLSGAQHTFHHPSGGSISARVSCNISDSDVPLHVLTNHLLFDFDVMGQQQRTPLTLDGRGALRTQLAAKLDGVPVALDLVVMKQDGCTVDFQLVSAPDAMAQRRPEFERFFHGYARNQTAK